VKPGDTLGGIAKEQLGSAGAYVKIFELNNDQLADPDKITHSSNVQDAPTTERIT